MIQNALIAVPTWEVHDELSWVLCDADEGDAVLIQKRSGDQQLLGVGRVSIGVVGWSGWLRWLDGVVNWLVQSRSAAKMSSSCAQEVEAE